MLTLVTGQPGASKTAYVVTQLDEIERKNKINLVKNIEIFNKNKVLFEKYRDDFEYFEIEDGSGCDIRTLIDILPSDYFDFVLEDFDFLRPDFYFTRTSRYNDIIERIHDREGDVGFKRLLPVRTVYSNIKALKIDNCRSMIHDWRDAPDGSIFAIDEVQLVDPFSNLKDKNNEIISHLTIHRHRGFDFFFITQFPALLHPSLSGLIGLHLHITRPYGRTPKVYQWGAIRTYPNTLINKLNCEAKFNFSPQDRIFKLYKSTSIDTSKKRFPKHIVFYLAFVCIGVFLFSYSFLTSGENAFIQSWLGNDKKVIVQDDLKNSSHSENKKNENMLNSQQSFKPSAPDLQAQEFTRPAMIIESSDTCKVTNSAGDIINVDLSTCKRLNSRASNLSFSKLDRSSIHSHSITVQNDQSDLITN